MTQEDIIAVFPLPNVVFFPKTSLPLHIFEPRYCEMVKETIANNQLIGMFVLQPGWQEDYYGNPPIYPVGCAGELVQVENLPEERFNIVLRGLYRAHALETIQEYPYRKVRVHVLPETVPRDRSSVRNLQKNLMVDFLKIATRTDSYDATLIEGLTDFDEIVNSVALALQLDVEVKMELLRQNDVFVRATQLRQLLKRQLAIFEWTDAYSHLKPKDPTVN